MSKLEEARKSINEIDKEMAELFVKRMEAVKAVFEYKKEFGLPIYDKKREASVIEANSALIEDEATLKRYYPEPERQRVRLHPENPKLQDIYVDDCSIQGVAVKVLKDLI